MRKYIVTACLFAALGAACGDGDPCIETDTICLERESPDTLVMSGDWKGTYHVERYWIGENDLSLSWHGDTYTLRARRYDPYRAAFYRDRTMVNTGSLSPRQQHFRVKYSTTEIWHFYGNYYLDDQQIVFKGWIETAGKTIGDFRLMRNRKCTATMRQRRDICIDEVDLESIEPAIDVVTLTPNPVSAGTDVRITATASPSAEWRWEVRIVPVTDATSAFATFSAQGETFEVTTPAPASAGDYAVLFSASGNGRSDKHEELLTVSPNP